MRTEGPAEEGQGGEARVLTIKAHSALDSPVRKSVSVPMRRVSRASATERSLASSKVAYMSAMLAQPSVAHTATNAPSFIRIPSRM